MQITYDVGAADHGRRAVDILQEQTGMSRLLCKRVRLYGSLTCNGKPWRMIDPVQTGDRLEAVYQPTGQEAESLRIDEELPFLYQDDWLVVVNKPANMVTHPTYLHERGAVTDRLADFPLHPVTRLDRDTSGAILIARNGHAHHYIGGHGMHKVYVALVHGCFDQPSGLIDAPINRNPDSLIERMVAEQGAPARTLWRTCHYFEKADVSLVRFELLTGRTHQIRVHSQYAGHPLLGDWLYGIQNRPILHDQMAAADRLSIDRLIARQALHAASLSFIHPLDGRSLLINAPLPPDFRQALTALFAQERDGLRSTNQATR